MINFIDIETSGLDPFYHEVIEVGIVAAEYGELVEKTEFSVEFDESRADLKALEINGWGSREFPKQLSREAAADRLRNVFASDEYFAAWHVHFDEAFLAELFRWPRPDGTGKVPWSHRRIIDLPSLVMGNMGVLCPGKQADLAKQLEVGMEDYGPRHTALADARLNYEIYNRLSLFEIYS